jgi:hypothetical protein
MAVRTLRREVTVDTNLIYYTPAHTNMEHPNPTLLQTGLHYQTADKCKTTPNYYSLPT